MANFGSDSQWIKGKLSGSDVYTYVNLYQCNTIQKVNEDNYIIGIGGYRIRINDCVWVGELTEIAPEEEA